MDKYRYLLRSSSRQT